MKYPGYFIDIMTCILYISDSARYLQTESEEQDIQEPRNTFAEVSHTGSAVESGDVDRSLSTSAVSFEDFSNIIDQPSDATTLNEDDITERCVPTTTETTRATTETTTTYLDLVSLPILEPPMASPCSESNPEGNERNEDNRPECEQMEHDSSKPAPSVLLDLDSPSHECRTPERSALDKDYMSKQEKCISLLPVQNAPQHTSCDISCDVKIRNVDSCSASEQTEQDSSKLPSTLPSSEHRYPHSSSHECDYVSQSHTSSHIYSQHHSPPCAEGLTLDVQPNYKASLSSGRQKLRNKRRKSEHFVRGADAYVILTGLKPACSECAFESEKLHAVTCHIRRMHMDISKRPYVCKMCSSRFLESAQLKTHIKKVHTSDKPFHCEHCSASWWSASDLRKHLLVHTGEKPHQCPHCPEKFRRPDRLKRHISSKHAALQETTGVKH